MYEPVRFERFGAERVPLNTRSRPLVMVVSAGIEVLPLVERSTWSVRVARLGAENVNAPPVARVNQELARVGPWISVRSGMLVVDVVFELMAPLEGWLGLGLLLTLMSMDVRLGN